VKSFLVAMQFLTRIPIKFKQIPTVKQTANSLLYYPAVGLIIGCLLYILNSVLFDFNDMLRAIIVLTTWVVITGALHLDGLADSADALVGGFGDKEKTLAIMKDPYCGPVGVASLVLLILFKFSLITSLNHNTSFLLIFTPMLARSSILLSFLTTPYIRENGLGSSIAKYFSYRGSIIWLICTFLLTLSFLGWLALILFLGLLIGFIILRAIMIRRIGGMTGDTIGAQIEIMETLFLLIAVLYTGFNL